MSKATATPQQNCSTELRASVDVLFEALAHIHASLEGETPDEHEAVYRQFKRALYERYDHALAQRRKRNRGVSDDPEAQAEETGAEREASAPIPGQGDGMVRGEEAASARPPDLETASSGGRVEDTEGDGANGEFARLWPTD